MLFVVLLLPAWKTLKILNRTIATSNRKLTDEELEKAKKLFPNPKRIEYGANLIGISLFFSILFAMVSDYIPANIVRSFQEEFIYGAKTPLLIQHSTGLFYLSSITLGFSYAIIASVLFQHSSTRQKWELSTPYVRDVVDHRINIEGSDIAVDYAKLLQVFRIMLVIIVGLAFVSVVYGLDDYFIANEEGIYINEYFSLGIEKHYKWIDVEYIIILEDVNADGRAEIYSYQLIMKDGETYDSGTNNRKIQQYIEIIGSRSEAKTLVARV